jgi:ribonucleoside-diphosphate reductase alpha chain
MSFVNQSVPRALRNLGYDEAGVEAIVAHIDEHHSALGAPGLDPAHLRVFACSLGADPIHHLGHVKMMGAVQPFISGAISKTVNLPESATIEEIELLLIESWRLGLKAVALYRDNCKVAQPMSAGNGDGEAAPGAVLASATVERVVEKVVHEPIREKLPRSRASRTFEFRVADCKGFVTVGEYGDGRPGEIFVRVSKQGSTLAGIMDAFAISLSHGLQYGVPLSAFVEAYVGMRFEPAGMTDDPDIRIANSLMDYLFRKLAVMYLGHDERVGLGILTTGERTQPTLPGVEEQVTRSEQGLDIPRDPAPRPAAAADAPFCMTCGVPMQRAGACYVCGDCGTTSGCS